MPDRKVAYIAVDQGPRVALQALAEHLPGTSSFDPDTELLICGTSDTPGGRAVEGEARRAASMRGVPCVAIEDFPGNYCAVRGGKPRLVVVANEFEARLARAKDAPLEVALCPAVRYDGLRRRLKELRAGPAAPQAILWIGQPETDDSLKTLRRLLPALRDYEVWFRAHPRDEGRSRGAYAGLPVVDVTSWTAEECLARHPRLVVTQFSSVAIEAGFWGIPSLHALFPDLGGKTLSEKKGYAIPPWCEGGAAFLITNPAETDAVLDRALRSSADREAVARCFDRYFQVSAEGAPVLINLLYNQGLL